MKFEKCFTTATTSTPPRPLRASENPPRKRKGKERERIPIMVRGAEEIKKKKKIILLNENECNFRKQPKVVLNKLVLNIKKTTKYLVVGPAKFWI